MPSPLTAQSSFNDTPSLSIPFSFLGLTLKGFDYFINACGGRDNLKGLTVTQVNERYQMIFTIDDELSYCDYLIKKGYNKDYVSKANVFISHAWAFTFLDTYDTLKDYFADKENEAVLWFDLFSNNQHKSVELEFSWWTNTFMSAIKSFGKTVMVLTPWSNPHPLKRSWCLYEIYSTVVTNGKFSIALSKNEQQSFLNAISNDPDAINKMLSAIHLESSQAFKDKDRQNIIDTVHSTCGFNNLNTIVFGEIRKWLVNVVEKELIQPHSISEQLCLRTILGDIMRQQGFLDQAEKIYLSVLKGWNELHGPKNKKSLAIMNRMGDLCYRKAQGADSLMYYMECLDEGFSISSTSEASVSEMDYTNKIIDVITSCPCCWKLKYRNPKVNPPPLTHDSSPEEIRSYYMLASLYYKQARRKKAEPMVIDSIAKLKRYLGDSSEEILVMKSNLASLYFYEAEYEKCEKMLYEAYNTMKTLNADHPLTLLMLKNLAYYYLDQKQFENAVDLFQELRDKVISKQGLKAQGVRTILLNHAISLYCNREYSKSLEVLNDAMKIAVSDVMSLLLNSTVEDGWSCKHLCVTSCFTCIENTFTCCIPCHFLTSNSSFNHVEVIVSCTLITTCSSYLCCCPLICLQTCFNQLK